ncbi:hypothetical protein BDV38DRAFT_276386 [Aspergillus pseudotamarii]|uniref:GPI anchored glycoprotein n=1 Tax=Aspergillus pseudotamarii TaxID=132259 RepID=A0A5N6SAC5_ASPPS|nr:uncharacterized protein BDV38DRAFT_276386 [Aspergillus pseudotamarii]KAE8130927.1 hypothetical protein BDV38DRAFT_276386 [Aspergillus pseudotamarii]
MHAQTLLSFAIMAFTSMAAADETATILFTEMDHDDLVGKVIGTDGPLTTYVINCNPKPQNANFYQIGDCDISSQGWTVTAGPSTMRVAFDYPHYSTMIEACSLHASTSLDCAITMDYGTSTEVESGGTVGPTSDFYQTVTITGTEIASGSASAQTSPTAAHATPTTTGSTSAAAAVVESGSVPQKAAASTASSSAEASQSTNAAMAKVTGSSKWAVGGAAAMAAIAMV